MYLLVNYDAQIPGITDQGSSTTIGSERTTSPMNGLMFDGDVIAVTGAGGGIGRALAMELARRGARVVVNDLGGSVRGGGGNSALASAVVEEIRREGGEAIANWDTVATPEGALKIVSTAVQRWGRLDGMAAN